MIFGVWGPVRIPPGPWRFIKACLTVLIAGTLLLYLIEHFSLGALCLVSIVYAIWRGRR
jgi:hypothetical protein